MSNRVLRKSVYNNNKVMKNTLRKAVKYYLLGALFINIAMNLYLYLLPTNFIQQNFLNRSVLISAILCLLKVIWEYTLKLALEMRKILS